MTGEAHRLHLFRVEQRLGGRSAAGREYIQDAVGQAGRLEELGQPNGARGRGRRGLQNDGVAGDQRRGDLPGRDRQRKVPRRDARHDTERLAGGKGELCRRFGTRRVAAKAAALAGHEFDDVDAALDFSARVFDRLAFFERDQPRQLLAVSVHQARGLQQYTAPSGGGRVAPCRPGFRGGAHGRLNQLEVSRAEPAEHLVGRSRVASHQIGRAGRLHALAANEVGVQTADVVGRRHGLRLGRFGRCNHVSKHRTAVAPMDPHLGSRT